MKVDKIIMSTVVNPSNNMYGTLIYIKIMSTCQRILFRTKGKDLIRSIQYYAKPAVITSERDTLFFGVIFEAMGRSRINNYNTRNFQHRNRSKTENDVERLQTNLRPMNLSNSF